MKARYRFIVTVTSAVFIGLIYWSWRDREYDRGFLEDAEEQHVEGYSSVEPSRQEDIYEDENPAALHDSSPKMINEIQSTDVTAPAQTERDAVEAIRPKLPSAISRDNMEEVYAFLKSSESAPGQSRTAMRNEKHSMMNALRNMNPPPSGLAELLIGIFMDKAQDEVIRDYAVQHMGLHFPKSSVVERRQIIDTLELAMLEHQSSMAGTALLALKRLSRTHVEVDLLNVGTHALSLAMNEECGVLSRMTAIQVCAELGVMEVIPTAEKLALSKGDTMLRRASISALRTLSRHDEALFARMSEYLDRGNCFDCP